MGTCLCLFTVVLFGNGFPWCLVTAGLQRSSDTAKSPAPEHLLSKFTLKQFTQQEGREGSVYHGGVIGAVRVAWCSSKLM